MNQFQPSIMKNKQFPLMIMFDYIHPDLIHIENDKNQGIEKGI